MTYKSVKSFWEKVDKKEEGDCWEWTASKMTRGYGQITINKKNFSAHRFSYELHEGKIPEGMQINHHCDNRACVNPKHLYLGTQKENVQDAFKRGGRDNKGEKHPRAKLTGEVVLMMRKLAKNRPDLTQKDLAREFNLSHSYTCSIINKKAWKHLQI